MASFIWKSFHNKGSYDWFLNVLLCRLRKVYVEDNTFPLIAQSKLLELSNPDHVIRPSHWNKQIESNIC